MFAYRSVRFAFVAMAGLLASAVVAPAPAAAEEEVAQASWVSEEGSASWYAASRHSRRTASGARYDQNAMTAAHAWLPFGAKVRVTRTDTGRSVVVTINDRLPTRKHVIDLSVGAAKRLGMLREGTTEVELEPAA